MVARASDPQTVSLGVDLKDYDDAASIGLEEARRMLRGRGGDPSIETVRRWANRKVGCRAAGLVLLLPAVKIGGELRTMRPWVLAFARMRERLGARQPPPRESQPRPKGRREKAHARAGKRLDEAGIGGA